MTLIRVLTSRWVAALALSSLLAVPLFAQNGLPALPVSQLTKPAGWQLAGSVLPGSGNTLKTKSGNALLVGSGTPLPLVTPTDDFQLRFDMLATPDADVSLQLPTGQRLSFQKEADLAKLLKAPGLWQTVEMSYKTGSANGQSGPVSATLEKLVLNGVTVREGELLPGKAAGALSIASPSGTVAIRNVGYRLLSPRTVARWSGPISYTIVEGGYIENPADARGKKVLKQDTTSLLNYEVGYGLPARQQSTFFKGKLNALTTGDYQFELNQGGVAGVWVDGKEVVPNGHRELGHAVVGTTNLTAGLHEVEVYLSRSWFRPGLGLFVSQAGTRPQPLHVLASLPEPDPVALISVVPETESERVRSFVQLPGETHKRTHSLSVGSPAGYHYTVDLNQMALLQVWKGDFANVTEMWYERGEPQLLETMGTTIRLPAQTALTVLSEENAIWPDSVDEKTLQYKGMTLDQTGNPTIQYMLAGATVTDVVRPTTDGLTRTLTLTGSPSGTVYCRVAAGKSIDDMGNGLYAIDDRAYFVRIDPKAKAKMRQSNGKQELLLPVKNEVAYSIVF